MAGAVTWKVEVTGAGSLQKALRVLAEEDAPFLRDALELGGRDLANAVVRHAPGGMATKTTFAGVKGKANGLRAVVLVKHRGAKAREFGRKFYYRGFTDRRMKATGQRFRAARGQRAQPIIGIVKGDAAIGAVGAQVRGRLVDAIHLEWSRIGAAD